MGPAVPPGALSLRAEPGRLSELAAVPWRRRADAASLRRRGRLWTLTTLAHSVPLTLTAAGVAAIHPVVTVPIALVLLAHAWAIPELYAARGAGVVRRSAPRSGASGASGAEAVALGLLGDLVGHEPRALHARTGLMLEPGELGTWLVGQAGALLVRAGGRRVFCYCVKPAQSGLPAGDRTAHLLLALRTDEAGFATVANLAFSGAPWRLRRRLPPALAPALDAAIAASRARSGPGRAAEARR